MRHAELKRQHPSRNQAAQLGLREPLADAAARAMQEGQQREVALGAAVVVGAAGIGIDPALRAEQRGVGAPQRRRAVQPPDRHAEVRALRDGQAHDRGVADRDAPRQRHRRVQPHRFVADRVEPREGFECRREVRGWVAQRFCCDVCA